MIDSSTPGGAFSHCMAYKLPASCHDMEKIIHIQKNLENVCIQAKNDFGKVVYRGYCPPESIHSREDFYPATKNLVLDKAEYKVTY